MTVAQDFSINVTAEFYTLSLPGASFLSPHGCETQVGLSWKQLCMTTVKSPNLFTNTSP